MNKIAFIGLILICGLFSLQYSLLGQRSKNTYTYLESVAEKMDESLTTGRRIEVVYICPDDSLQMRRIERAAEILL